MAGAHAEQLAWERRAGRTVGILAFVAAAIYVGARISPQLVTDERPTARDAALTLIDRVPSVAIVPASMTAAATLLLAVVVGYLYMVTRYRRPQLTRLVLPVLIAGTVVSAGAAVLQGFEYVDAARDWVESGRRGDQAATRFLAERDALGQFGLAYLAGVVVTGLAIIVVAINAMRAGVLSRFLGLLGIVLAALPVIGVVVGVPLALTGPSPLFLLVWLVALGLLFIDRYPRTRGPAWSSGEPDPWPSAAQRFEEARDAETGTGAGTGAAPELESGEAGDSDGRAVLDEDAAGTEPDHPQPAGQRAAAARQAAARRRKRRRRR